MSRLARGAIVVLVTVASAVITTGAAAGSGVGAAAKPVKGGTLTIGITNEVPSLDPVRLTVGSLTQGGDRSFLIHGSLMKLNSKTGAIIPGLAESVTSNDAQTWTLKLRPNVKFSDGTPFDADAVIYGIQRMQDPANAFTGIASVSQIAKMNKVDATTVEFRLTQPNGSFPVTFTDSVGMIGSPTAIKADPRGYGTKPVGAGPFTLKEWVRDRTITLVRNPNYWDQPRPYLDQIVFRVIPDQATLANAFSSGEVDAIHVASGPALKAAEADPKNLRGFDPTKSSGAIGMACNLDKAPCNDVRYREALSLSFDFKLAKSVFLADFNYPANTLQCMPWGPGSPYCAKDVKVKYNPEKAKKLFADVKADGINTDLTYTYNTGTTSAVSNGEWIQQQLAKVGVKVTPVAVSTNDYVTITNQHTFQGAIVYNPPLLDMSARFYNDWHSSGGPNGGRDVALFNNASLDVALEKGRNALKLDDRIAGFQEAQRIIAKNFLVMWIYPQLLGVVSKKALQLPSYVSPNAPVYRYDEAWLSSQK